MWSMSAIRSNGPQPATVLPVNAVVSSQPIHVRFQTQNERSQRSASSSIVNLTPLCLPQSTNTQFLILLTNQKPVSNFPIPMKPKLGFLVLLSVFCSIAESKCSQGCGLALASYYTWEGSNLTFIAEVLQSDLNITPDTIVSYNKQKIPNKYSVGLDIRINVPFPCNCINGEYLGYVFDYTVRTGDKYTTVAQTYYANLTTYQSLQTNNSFDPNMIPDVNTRLKVPVTCSCGSSSVSREYGLFITYPLRPNETVEKVAAETGFNSTTLLQSYNPGVDFSQGSGLVYIPGKGDKFRYALSSRNFMQI